MRVSHQRTPASSCGARRSRVGTSGVGVGEEVEVGRRRGGSRRRRRRCASRPAARRSSPNSTSAPSVAPAERLVGDLDRRSRSPARRPTRCRPRARWRRRTGATRPPRRRPRCSSARCRRAARRGTRDSTRNVSAGFGRGDVPRCDLAEHERQLRRVEHGDVDAARVAARRRRPSARSATALRPVRRTGAVEVIAAVDGRRGVGSLRATASPSPIAAAIARPHGGGRRVLVGGRHVGSRAVRIAAAGRPVERRPAGLGDDVAARVGDVGRAGRPRSRRRRRAARPAGRRRRPRRASSRGRASTSSSRCSDSGPCSATVSAIGSRSSPLPPLASALTGHGHDAAAAPAGWTTSTAIDASAPARRPPRGRRSASPGTPARHAGRGVGALRRVVQRHARRAPSSATAATTAATGGDGGDEGRATATAGQGRHASLPYRPRSAMTCSTGSVTR